MSSKVGTILSSIFIILAFLFGTDLINLQYIYSDLDSKSINISYLISKTSPKLDDDFRDYIEEKFDVTFQYIGPDIPAYGDEIFYRISTIFNPLMIASESMTVSIERYVYVGFYG